MLMLKGIAKGFPGVRALNDVDFEARSGEIHALVGENGAGKSTLTRVIAGVHQPDAGTITFDGQPTVWKGPGDAKRHGVHVIYQEFVLFPHLSVAENIFIGHERRNRLGLIDHRVPAPMPRRSWSGSASTSIRAAASATCRSPTSRWSRSPRR